MFTRSKILGVNNGQLSVVRSPNRSISTSPKKVEASMISSDMLGGSTVNKSVNAFWQSNYQYMMTGIIPATPDLTDSQSLALFYRDMYLHDSVAGSAVDIQSTFPFSDWELRGLDAPDIKIYNDSLERLNLQELLPQISVAYLTDGFFAGSLVFDPRSKQFMDILIHDALCCEIINSPFHNIEPTITVHTNGQTKFYLDNPSEYAKAYLASMPSSFLELLKSDAFELDPVSTLYIARRQLTDRAYTSYLQRLLPMYLIEKVLFRGTLVEAQRRQRATTHIQAGDDLWTPTDDELHAITEMFQATEADPLGAWIATRNNIQVSEFRTAGDIWKWYETSESLTPMKLRALGISDAFLSGDACLTGDTLIPTKQGLVRIDSLGEGKNRGVWSNLNVRTLDRYGSAVTKAWTYNGYRKTYKITTDYGNSICATDNHPVLILDNEGNLVYKRVDKLHIGDIACVNSNACVRKSKLKLPGLPPKRVQRPIKTIDKNGQYRGVNPNSHNTFIPGEFKCPKYMTPELAQWLALFISEGWCTGQDKQGIPHGPKCVSFINSERKVTQRFADLSKSLFDIDCQVIKKSVEALNRYKDETDTIFSTKPCYCTTIKNRRLCDWLISVGCSMKIWAQCEPGTSPAWYKVVPWSILQADEQSQIAFLATYAECDGNIMWRTTWVSSSQELLDQIFALLNAHGYQAKRMSHSVYIDRESHHRFWSVASKWLICKKPKFGNDRKYSNRQGVPAQHWIDFIESRKVKFDRHGSYFLTDNKEVICFSCHTNNFGFSTCDIKRFNYDRYDNGQYDNFLKLLKAISKVEYTKLITALKSRYRFTPIVSIADNGKQHVYDISMQKDPSFVANGLIVHNSYASSESAYSTFVETVDAYRTHLTNKIFYNKIFPLIAVVNGLYNEGVDAPKPNTIAQFLFNANNKQAMRMPKIHWHKQLEVRDQQSQFDMLEKISEHGIPVPLTTWIAAAGMDIEALLRDLEESTDLEQKLAQYKKNPDEEGGGDDDFGMFASVKDNRTDDQLDDPTTWTTTSMKSKWAKLKRKPLLARQFSEEDNAEWNVHSDGKRTLKVHQEASKKDRLWKIAKIISKYHNDPHYRSTIVQKNKQLGIDKLKGFQ